MQGQVVRNWSLHSLGLTIVDEDAASGAVPLLPEALHHAGFIKDH
jgi:hypothetical protein